MRFLKLLGDRTLPVFAVLARSVEGLLTGRHFGKYTWTL